jgi:NAD(P)-dependent dehydrogenase (short-subunit alcohol dehydrogenase family)
MSMTEPADEMSDIRVNCSNPGTTRTAMRKAGYPGEASTTSKHKIVLRHSDKHKALAIM